MGDLFLLASTQPTISFDAVKDNNGLIAAAAAACFALAYLSGKKGK